MAKSRPAGNMEFPAMETPKDAKVENAARKYRKSVALRQEQQKDEANCKAKVEELVLAWADANNIKPIQTTDDKGKKIERYVYRRGDIEVTAERPLKWNTKVRLGDEIPDEEGDPAAIAEESDAE